MHRTEGTFQILVVLISIYTITGFASFYADSQIWFLDARFRQTPEVQIIETSFRAQEPDLRVLQRHTPSFNFHALR
jgi:hypothetical protein